MTHILVVDDEPSLREVLAAILGDAGYRVTTLASGMAALPVAQRERPDLLLLDVMMPDRTGYEVLQDLQAAGVRCPVVLMSAHVGRARQAPAIARALGAADFLAKPFDLEQVRAVVAAALRAAAPERPA